MTFVIVLLLVGLNGPFRYEETHPTRADCLTAYYHWKQVKEAQILKKCERKKGNAHQHRGSGI